MNTRNHSWVAALLLAAALFSAEVYYERPAQADTHVNVGINFFYDALAPYGNWVDHRLYGRVWYPTGVSAGWRPYTDGHWDYTYEYGWVWVSDWDWGWAPFHYGRWVWDDWYGWVWVPGSVWAPAWVVWRYGGGYAAWAPMPPNLVWNPGYGLTTTYFDYDRDLPWDCWVGVPEQHFHERHINRFVIDPRHNDRFMHVARNFVYVGTARNTIFNHGIPVRQIERASGSRIQPFHFREVERPEERGRDTRRDMLKIYRPHIRTSGEDELRRQQQLAEQLSRQNDERRRHEDNVRGGERGGEQQRRLPGRFQQEGQPGAILPPGTRGREFSGGHREVSPERGGRFDTDRSNLEAWQRQRRGQQDQLRQPESWQLQEQQTQHRQEMPGGRLPQEEQWIQQQQHRGERQGYPQSEELRNKQQQLEMQQRQSDQADRLHNESIWQQQRREQQGELSRRQEMMRQEQVEAQRRQAERGYQEQLRQQQEMEMQRNRLEQERANRDDALRRNQEMPMQRQQQMREQQERAYQQLQQQENMRRQQEMQRQQEVLQMQRQQQVQEQQERARYQQLQQLENIRQQQEMQIQRQQEMQHQQQIQRQQEMQMQRQQEVQRQQSEQMRQRRMEERPSGGQWPLPPQ